MKAILIDASVSACWWLREETNPIAEWVLDQVSSGTPILAPSLWLLETVNLLFNAQRRRRIDQMQKDWALGQMELLPLTLLTPATLSDLKTLTHLSEKHQLTAYDAEYLRVARLHRATLASLDSNLVAAAKREKVAVA